MFFCLLFFNLGIIIMVINLVKFLYLFLFYAFCGYLWEVLLYVFKFRKFVNRGEMIGPWISVYGYGGIFISYVLRPYVNNVVLLFLLSLVGCALLEYVVSLYEEKIYKRRWWDYSNMFLNFEGRICLLSVVLFGFLGIIVSYYVYPFIIGFYSDSLWFTVVVMILFTLYVVDFVYTSIVPHDGEYISFMVE